MKKSLLLILLSAMILTGCSSGNNIITADVCVLSNQTISRDCVLNGIITYASEPDIIKTDITGVAVEKLCVSKGSYVEKGDLICTLNTESLRSEADSIRERLNAAEQKKSTEKARCQAALNHAKSSMQAELDHINSGLESNRKKLEDINASCYQAENEYAELLREAETTKNLFDSSEDPDSIQINGQIYAELSAKADAKFEEIQVYKDTASSLENSIKEAGYSYEKAQADGELAISQAEYELKQLDSEDMTDDKTRLSTIEKVIANNAVTAEKSGYIAELYIKEGMSVYDQQIGEICSCNELRLEMIIPDKYILSINEGAKISFSSSSLNNTDYSGEIQSISKYREEDGFKAIVSIDNANELIAGMTAAVVVDLNEKNVSAVPVSAVHNDADGNSYVYTAVEAENGKYKVKKTDVKVGISNSDYIEIKSKDIQEDSYIITSKDNYTDGQIISVDPEDLNNVSDN